ncbi:MAG TPA: hypothetical protein VD967_03520 [Candidatus Paceibacterota bacterium]|nr:hypothetical protein [Candidatus Paceibacterota bacterium]
MEKLLPWQDPEKLSEKEAQKRLMLIEQRGFKSRRRHGDAASKVVFEEDGAKYAGVIYDIATSGFIKVEIIVGKDPVTKLPKKEVLGRIFEPSELTLLAGSPGFQGIKTERR